MTARLAAILSMALLVGGCASKVPEAIREPVPGSPGPADVRKEPAVHLGDRVRWGGTIAAVYNLEASTRLEVVARPLGAEGRPRPQGPAPGRFLAEVSGFLDPAIYAQGRQVTVKGTVAEPETRPIGEYAYRFPVVRVQAHYLWPREKPDRSRPPPSWYHDPWHPYYGPRYPYW